MKLIELKMSDFRQFKGEVSLGFSSSDDKPTTVIHGENGVGKTTILNAIYWCFYGKLLDEFEKPQNLVNDEVINGNIGSETRVGVLFEHNDIIYRVERWYDQIKKNTGVDGFTVLRGNNTPVDGIGAVINRIIPLTMAPYFFFHGEGLNSLGSGTGKMSFREAIRSILGFNHADNALSMLGAIRLKWQKQLTKLGKLDNQARDALAQEVLAQEGINDASAELEQARGNLSTVEESLLDVNEKLAKIKIQNIDQLNNERQKLEKRQRDIPIEIERIEEKRIRLISKYGWSIFGFSFLEDSAKTLKKFRTQRKLPSEYNDVFVRDLLDSERCICGTALHNDTEARKKVEEMLVGASTSEQEDAITKATGIAENIADVSDEYTRHVTSCSVAIKTLTEEKGKNARRLEEIEEKLAGIDEPEKDRLEAERKDLSKLASNLRDAKHLAQIKLTNCKKSFEEAKRKKTKMVDESKLGVYKDRLDFIDSIIELAKHVIEIEEESARGEIEGIINERLEKFSRKDYYAEVRDDFSFELKKQDGTLVAKSKGERALLNISFISALIQLAKSRCGEDNEYFIQGTVAPFVIDAPFGELDNEYRGAVAKFLPESTQQLVTLLSSSHWGDVVEYNLRPSIGKEYVLISESTQSINSGKTIDELSINGKKFQCSRYSMKHNRTVLEQV